MFNFTPGYYKVRSGIEVNRYYVLSLKNLRKPILLRFACKSAFYAKRYIILKTNPAFHEVIKGEDAMERGIPLSKKRLLHSNFPEKYCYPKGCNTWQKKKQHRTNYRADLRKALEFSNSLKQFTIHYRSKTYSLYEFTISKAFNYLHKYTGMSWGHFVKNVSSKPTPITKGMVYIKTYQVNSIMINHFNKLNHGRNKTLVLKHPPSIGKMAGFESSYFSIRKPKPQRLLF